MGIDGEHLAREVTAVPVAWDQQMPWLLHADEVGRLTGFGRSKVYEMMAAGELPVVRIGTSVRVPSRRLMEWIEARTEG